MKKILPYILAAAFAVAVMGPGPGASPAEALTVCKKHPDGFICSKLIKIKANRAERVKDRKERRDARKAKVEPVKKSILYGPLPKTVRYGYGRDHWRHGPGWGRGPGAGEIIGGIVIGNAINNWLFPPPKPEVVVVEAPPEGPPAWTTEWFDYCNGKYKSFDAKTGYYTGFDGVQHFCK